jgi:GWxTD domain-containing protein
VKSEKWKKKFFHFLLFYANIRLVETFRENVRKMKPFFLVSLLCFAFLSVSAQKKKVIVCDQPSDAAAYKKWIERDAAYIVTKEEKEAYLKLETNAERQQFIDNFWLRRDPTPATERNEFQEEHYERIAYANEHFASGIPGWMTDRGRIYINYGKPDRVETGRAEFESLKNVLFERWFYDNPLQSCAKTDFTFLDPTETKEFRLPLAERERIFSVPNGFRICDGL